MLNLGTTFLRTDGVLWKSRFVFLCLTHSSGSDGVRRYDALVLSLSLHTRPEDRCLDLRNSNVLKCHLRYS